MTELLTGEHQKELAGIMRASLNRQETSNIVVVISADLQQIRGGDDEIPSHGRHSLVFADGLLRLSPLAGDSDLEVAAEVLPHIEK